jgi:hypothetical protein
MIFAQPGELPPGPGPHVPDGGVLSAPPPTASVGVGLYAIIFGVALAYGIYHYLQTSSQRKQ